MSQLNCDLHGRRTPGALEGFRLSLYNDRARYTRRLRLCPDHIDAILERRGREWTLLDNESYAVDASVCSSCKTKISEPSERVSAAAYVYRRRQEPAEYFAWYCDPCSLALIEDYGLERETSL